MTASARAALGVGQDGTRRLRARAPRARVRARLVGRHRGRDRRRRHAGDAPVRHDRRAGDARAPRRHVAPEGARRDPRRSREGVAPRRSRDSTASSRSTSSCRTSTRSSRQPDIETIDIGGPAMTRAAAKNHAWVGHRDGTRAVRRGARGAARRRRARSATPRRRRLALEAFARTAEYDAAIVRWLEGDEVLPEHLVLPLERTPRSCGTARTRTSAARATGSRAPRAGGTASSSTAASRSAT